MESFRKVNNYSDVMDGVKTTICRALDWIITKIIRILFETFLHFSHIQPDNSEQP